MEESSAEPQAKWGTEAALRDERLTDWVVLTNSTGVKSPL